MWCEECETGPLADGPSGTTSRSIRGTYAKPLSPLATTTAGAVSSSPESSLTWNSPSQRSTETTCTCSASGTSRSVNHSPYRTKVSSDTRSRSVTSRRSPTASQKSWMVWPGAGAEMVEASGVDLRIMPDGMVSRQLNMGVPKTRTGRRSPLSARRPTGRTARRRSPPRASFGFPSREFVGRMDGGPRMPPPAGPP